MYRERFSDSQPCNKTSLQFIWSTGGLLGSKPVTDVAGQVRIVDASVRLLPQLENLPAHNAKRPLQDRKSSLNYIDAKQLSVRVHLPRLSSQCRFW